MSGEESPAQVRLRAGRTHALADQLLLAAENDLGTVLGHIEEVAPSLLVVDSVQTISTAEADGSPGGVTQVREVTGALVRVAKRRGMAVIIVGHVTKDGAIAGPRMLEHLVDVVLSFEGDRHSGFRWCGPPRTGSARPTRWAASRWPTRESSRSPIPPDCSPPGTPSRCPGPASR